MPPAEPDREALLERLRPVKLLLLDVDGVLTDGAIILNDEGHETKHFNVKDGHGVTMLRKMAGLEVGIITGRRSRVVEHRAREMGIELLHQKIWDKCALADEILAERGLTDAQVAYMGDDIQDAKLLRRVGFAAAPADAHPLAKESVHYVTRAAGGKGAVREVCDLLLEAQGWWPKVTSGEKF